MRRIAGKLRWALAIGVTALFIGCVEYNYLYRPAEQATATVEGYSAARYAIPPEAPRGDVRVASFGITDIEQDGREPIPSTHVRLVVSNDAGARSWTVDTRQIKLDVRGSGDAGRPLVSTDAGGLPVVEVPPGQQRVIDLFFPLSKGMEDGEDVPAFDVTWSVLTDTRLVTERTPFERVEMDPTPRQSMWVAWHGPYWWYDPWYSPRTIVVHPVMIARPRGAPTRIYVRPRR